MTNHGWKIDKGQLSLHSGEAPSFRWVLRLVVVLFILLQVTVFAKLWNAYPGCSADELRQALAASEAAGARSSDGFELQQAARAVLAVREACLDG